jgi:hypothetical protein
MSIVVLQLPDVKRESQIQPQLCPYCPDETLQRWGCVRKPMRDVRYRSVQMYHYRCCHCRRTFRHIQRGWIVLIKSSGCGSWPACCGYWG